MRASRYTHGGLGTPTACQHNIVDLQSLTPAQTETPQIAHPSTDIPQILTSAQTETLQITVPLHRQTETPKSSTYPKPRSRDWLMTYFFPQSARIQPSTDRDPSNHPPPPPPPPSHTHRQRPVKSPFPSTHRDSPNHPPLNRQTLKSPTPQRSQNRPPLHGQRPP